MPVTLSVRFVRDVNLCVAHIPYINTLYRSIQQACAGAFELAHDIDASDARQRRRRHSGDDDDDTAATTSAFTSCPSRH